MKVTIENIKGIDHTVVWHDGEIKQPAEISHISHDGFCYVNGNFYQMMCLGGQKGYSIHPNRFMYCAATALPPLPRIPNPEDVESLIRLLCLYRNNGIKVFGSYIHQSHRGTDYAKNYLSNPLLVNILVRSMKQDFKYHDVVLRVFKTDSGKTIKVALI